MVVMDGREEAKLRLGRGVVVAVSSLIALSLMTWLGALSNMFSTTVMTTLAVLAIGLSFKDVIGGVCGLLWSPREPPLVNLPRARVVGPT
jgi:hypothetical protein